MKSRRGCVRSSERLWKKTVERLVVGRIPQLARLFGVAVPSLLRNRAKRWGEKQIIQGFDRVFTQSGELLGVPDSTTGLRRNIDDKLALGPDPSDQMGVTKCIVRTV